MKLSERAFVSKIFKYPDTKYAKNDFKKIEIKKVREI